MLDEYGFNYTPVLQTGKVAIQNFLLEQKLSGREEITFSQIRDSIRNFKQFKGVQNLYLKMTIVLREMERKGQLKIKHCVVMLQYKPKPKPLPAPVNEVLDDYGFNLIPNLTSGKVAIQNYLLKQKLKGRETITFKQILSSLRNRKQFDGVRSIYLKVKRVLEEMEEKGQLTIDRQTITLNQPTQEAHQ